MGAIEELGRYLPQMTEWRRHIHSNPETAFEEVGTARFVAERLRSFGVDAVHEGIARTGVVGVIRAGTGSRAIGLRADLDALDMQEGTGVAWASRNPGKHHACGHDGHTTMLLGAARHLAATRAFDGTVYVIFQPAEENEGGGRVMVEEGLFERFPMESVFGMHNIPGMEAGTFAIRPGPMMASYDIFEITITGRGAHGAMPHHGIDPITIGAELVQKLQTIVSRNVDPLEPAVLSVTKFHSGTAWNIIPNDAVIGGTVRAFSEAVQAQVEQRISALCEGTGTSHGAMIAVRYERRYPPTVNSVAEAELCAKVAESLVGADRVARDKKPAMGSEDFAWMLRARPGAYMWIGNGTGSRGGCMVHNPGYDFNDAVLPIGAAYWVRLAETALARR
ncbi:MAG: M20 family metallopeptidase [Burkholderiaceae bacterium]|jgi:hippurate hydrolase|nr:amidohydrolase [Burkholderiales bacterium]MCZ8102222.1 M20 family metallopeptidase [Burkholderiales bacterium]MCZ8340273.1 M20 family metallopeptidase [Burkholderiaceae bacterium]